MIIVDRTASREEQLRQQTERCYDDFCFYNRIDPEERSRFVQESMTSIGTNEFVLPYLPVYLTTACSLNCEKCNNLMPYFHGRAWDFSIEKTKSSLDRILSSVKEMIFCELVGGEPFLFKRLEEMLDYVAAQKKIRQIVIVTNGTVIPNDSVIEKLRDYKVLVRVSDYGLFEKMAAFVAKMENFGVNVRVLPDMKWSDPGGIEKRGRNRDQLRIQYNMCEFSMKCKYLCEDIIFSCARAASLYHLGKFDSNKDMLRVTDETGADELREFYLRDEGDICDYCDLFTADSKEIDAAIQIGDNKFRHSGFTVISNYEFEHYKKMTREYEQLLARKDT